MNLEHIPSPPPRTYRIGAVGAGFIMRDVQLVSYRNAGFDVAATTQIAEAQTPPDLRAIHLGRPYHNPRFDVAAIASTQIAEAQTPPDFRAIPALRLRKVRL